MVAEQRKRRLPGDAIGQALGKGHHLLGILACTLEKGQHLLIRFATRKHACEKA